MLISRQCRHQPRLILIDNGLLSARNTNRRPVKLSFCDTISYFISLRKESIDFCQSNIFMLKSQKNQAIISLILLAITLFVSYLGASGAINNLSQADVSAKYPTLITPAGYAFSIWSLIYISLPVFVLYQLFRAVKHSAAPGKIHPLFWLSNAFNMAWIVAFSYEQMLLSVVFIIGLLTTLYQINQSITHHLSGKDSIIARFGFGLYEGWVTVATIVNIAAFLVSIKWQGFGINPYLWSIAVLLVGLIIFSLRQRQLHNPLYSLAGAWAYVAIWVASFKQPDPFFPFQVASLLGAIFLLALSIPIFYQKFRLLKPNK